VTASTDRRDWTVTGSHGDRIVPDAGVPILLWLTPGVALAIGAESVARSRHVVRESH
jgi:hypothetical protein